MATKKRVFKRIEKGLYNPSLREYWELYGKDFSKIIRDLSVQRKGVWSKSKQQEYFTDVAIGNADNNPLHYVDLQSSIDAARKLSDHGYAKHLQGLADGGAIQSHLDGGNRTDSIVFTLGDIIPLAKGTYDYGVTDQGKHIFFELEEDTFFKDLDKDFREIILEQKVSINVYFGLSKIMRKKLFKKLNDGIPLNDPEKRNCEESDICSKIRELDLQYSDLFQSAGVLTPAGTERWKLSEHIAKLIFAKRNIVVSDSNTIAVKWASSRDIDSDYVAGSTADIGIDYEIKFLETNFIKLLKIFKRENFKFLEKNVWTDYWLVKCYMDKKDIRLIHPVSQEKEIEFAKMFAEKSLEFMADNSKDYTLKYTKGKPVYGNFEQLYTKNRDDVLTQRLERWVREFINPLVKEEKTLVQVTKRTVITRKVRADVFMKQEGKTTISGKEIHPLKLHEHDVDHREALRNGGADEKYNLFYENPSDNRKKSAKKDDINPLVG